MKKRTIAITVTVALLCSGLIGCSGGDSTSDAQSNQESMVLESELSVPSEETSSVNASADLDNSSVSASTENTSTSLSSAADSAGNTSKKPLSSAASVEGNSSATSSQSKPTAATLEVVITGKSQLRMTGEKNPSFPVSTWTEMCPVVESIGGVNRAIISTNRSAIYNLLPGKNFMDADHLDLSSGVMVTYPDYMTATAQMKEPSQVVSDTYWRRNYYGSYTTYQKKGNLFSFNHGENKNEIINGKKYNNSVKPADTPYVDTDYSGYGSNGVYTDSWDNYFGFISLSWCKADEVMQTGSLMKNDMGPVVWPDYGYLNMLDNSNGGGLRHPSAFLDGDYVYLYYLEGTSTSFGIKVARAKLDASGKPGAFKKYYDGSFSQDALPKGFNKNDKKFFYEVSGQSSPIFQANNPCRFFVRKVKGTKYYLGVQEEISSYGHTIYLRVSADLVNWSEPAEIPGVLESNWQSGNLHYPMLYPESLVSANEIDPNGFYVAGTVHGPSGSPLSQTVKLSIKITEK